MRDDKFIQVTQFGLAFYLKGSLRCLTIDIHCYFRRRKEYRSRRQHNFKQGENMPRPKGSANKNRSELVQLALAGIDAQLQQLQSQIDVLTDKRKQISKSSAGGEAAPAASVASKGRKAASAPVKKKRAVSAATRKKLKDAAKARWARKREEEGAE